MTSDVLLDLMLVGILIELFFAKVVIETGFLSCGELSWKMFSNVVFFNQFLEIFLHSWNSPGWTLIDIQSISALIQKFLRFQRCSDLNRLTLILTYLVITDSVMNISEQLWFSVERYWQAANRRRPWKKPKQAVFSILMLKGREIKNFRLTFKGLFWKILKMYFLKSAFSFDSMTEDFLIEQKRWKIPKSACNTEKNLTGVNFDVLTVFLGEHVKCLRQQVSWLDQKKSVFFFRVDSALFRIHQSLFDGAE